MGYGSFLSEIKIIVLLSAADQDGGLFFPIFRSWLETRMQGASLGGNALHRESSD
jgi:hypothetical protein